MGQTEEGKRDGGIKRSGQIRPVMGSEDYRQPFPAMDGGGGTGGGTESWRNKT